MCVELIGQTPVEESHRLVERGISALQANNPNEAVSHLEQALAFQKGNPDAYYYLARALNDVGAIDLAKETLALAQDRLPSIFGEDGSCGPYPNINFGSKGCLGNDSEVLRSHELLTKAKVIFHQGDPTEAISILMESLEANPWNPHAYYHLARVFAHIGEPGRAKTVFAKAINDFPIIFARPGRFGEYQGNCVDSKTVKAYYDALSEFFPDLLIFYSTSPEIGTPGGNTISDLETHFLKVYTEAQENWLSRVTPEPSKAGVFWKEKINGEPSVLLVVPRYVRCTPEWDEYAIFLHLKGSGLAAFERFEVHEADAIHTENSHLVEPRSDETLQSGIDELAAHLDRLRPDIVFFEGTFMGGQQCIDREQLEHLKNIYGFKLVTLVIDAHRPLPNYARYWSPISDLIISQNEHPYLDEARINCAVLVGPVLPVDFSQIEQVEVEKKDLELLFIGARKGYRDLWLAHLLDAQVPLFYKFTDKSAQHSVGQQGYIELLKRGRATLSSGLVTGNEHTINFRIFEAIVSETTLLQLDFPQLSEYFVPYVHYAPFSNIDELIGTARFLSRRPEIGERIASEALAWYNERYAAPHFWQAVAAHLAR